VNREKGKEKGKREKGQGKSKRRRSAIATSSGVVLGRNCQVRDRGFIFSRLAIQLLKSGTSIGANLEEGVDGQSKPDFITKTCIALKEARETRYWLRLITASEESLRSQTEPLIAEASEFVAILTTSIKTAPSNTNRGAPTSQRK
jgi:four helix bundle protein